MKKTECLCYLIILVYSIVLTIMAGIALDSFKVSKWSCKQYEPKYLLMGYKFAISTLAFFFSGSLIGIWVASNQRMDR